MMFLTENVVYSIQEYLVQLTKLLSLANKLFLTGDLVS